MFLPYRKRQIKVEVDGKEETVNLKDKGTDAKIYARVIQYESKDLELANHTVVLKNIDDGFVFDAVDIQNGELNKVNEVLNVEPENEKAGMGETINANVVIDKAQDIAAEDMIIKYDNSKLKFLGSEKIEGIKVINDTENEGEIRVTLVSEGKDNVVNSRKNLIKLKFEGIATGDALIDITKGKISDGIKMEHDLEKKNVDKLL